jgi:hypothetical protein
MDFAGGIWAFRGILVPSTALSIQEFKKRSQEPEFRRQEAQGMTYAGLTKITAPLLSNQ